jgi:hypothetical protein
MTPQATAIAGFAFAVFSMLGQGSWSIALTSLFWGENYSVGAVGNVMAAWGVGCLVMATTGAWLASSTIRTSSHTWEAHVARAAVLVAAAGAVLAVLTILGALIHGR